MVVSKIAFAVLGGIVASRVRCRRLVLTVWAFNSGLLQSELLYKKEGAPILDAYIFCVPSMADGCVFHGTTMRLPWKIPRINRYIVMCPALTLLQGWG